MPLIELVTELRDSTDASNPFYNRYHFRSTGDVTPNIMADNCIAAFKDDVIPALLPILSSVMTITNIYAYDLFNPNDFAASVVPYVGTSTGTAAPRQVIAKFQTPQFIRKRNRGSKAIGRISENMTQSDGSVAPTYTAIVSDLETALGTPTDYTVGGNNYVFMPSVFYYPPVVDPVTGKNTYPLPPLESDVVARDATTWTFRWYSGQNTRQR